MNEAILHLKDGQSHTVSIPAGRELHDIVHYTRVPADAAGKTLRLQAPSGTPIAVSAGAIAGLEIPPPYALIPDLMTDAELERVLAFTLAHTDAFQSSGVHEAPKQNGAPDSYGLRRSRVLEGPANGAMAALILPKVQALMPKLWVQWRINPMPLTRLECQVTAHGDGDFFAMHTDNGMPEIAHRLVSYVYYFHREPKQFSGGQLRLYHTLFKNGVGQCGRVAANIDPPRNGLMVFPSFICHEVMPIQCASNALTDQRLTLNGWLF